MFPITSEIPTSASSSGNFSFARPKSLYLSPGRPIQRSLQQAAATHAPNIESSASNIREAFREVSPILHDRAMPKVTMSLRLIRDILAKKLFDRRVQEMQANANTAQLKPRIVRNFV